LDAEGSSRVTSHGLPPLIGATCHVLVLGSLPSRASIEAGRYYAHRRNAFWPIMEALFGAGAEPGYDGRKALLNNAGIGVWDVLAASIRPGSLDTSIDRATAEPNDFDACLGAHPELRAICFNGRTAAELFRRLVEPDVAMRLESVEYLHLPSTSPAHAALSFDQKLARWRDIRQFID